MSAFAQFIISAGRIFNLVLACLIVLAWLVAGSIFGKLTLGSLFNDAGGAGAMLGFFIGLMVAGTTCGLAAAVFDIQLSVKRIANREDSVK